VAARPVDDGAGQRKQRLEAALRGDKRAVLVVNTQSRSGRRLFRDARRLLVERGLRLDATFAVRDPSRLPDIIRAALADGQRFVIIGGGDGTLSSVVDFLAHRDVVLGILPIGTANSFARSLGLPLDLVGAVDVVAAGKVADVDLGMINDDYFANAAAIGLATSIAREISPGLKRRLGRVGYLLVAGARLLRHGPFHCTVRSRDRTIAFDALEVRLANGSYQGGVQVADDAHVESHDLVVQSITGRSRWSILTFWARAILGMKAQGSDVEVLRATELTLETDPRQYVSIDGEPLVQTPIRARVARQALFVTVPREREDIH
jgi:YegS/Rv2252/BmrU family lipid kinase